MTATEQLRKLLDERGIGWYSRTRELQQWNQEQIDFHTAWSVNGARFEAEEDATEKKLHVRSYAYLLPEQAIAATLGTPISADLRTALDFMRIWITDDAHLGESAISYEFEKAEGLRKLDAIEQAIAATLGRGTCEPDEAGFCPYCGEDLVRCDVGIGAGGGAVELDPPIYHNYCPNCGAKVVSE